MGRGWLLPTLVLLGWLALPQAAQAAQYSCEVSRVTGLNFGGIDANPTAATGTTGQVEVTCTGGGNSGGARLKVCVGIPGPQRDMRDGLFGGTALAYQIRRDGYNGAVIGLEQPNAIGYVLLDTSSGPGNSSYTGSTTITLYGVIVPGQSGLPGGNYLDLVFGRVRSSTDLDPASGCAGGSVEDEFGTFAYAEIEERCTVVAEPLRFGTHFDLSASVTASAGLGLTCTAGTAYTVRLDGGATGNPDARRMRLGGVGPDTIDYALYQDPGRSLPWGNLPATSVGGVGDGAPTTLTVYGLVPGGQPPPAVGTYSDTVTVTVEY